MRSLLFMVAMLGGAACITNERAPDRPEADGADAAEIMADEVATGDDAEVAREGDVPPCSGPGECDDHNACTIDTCEPAIGCLHANASETIACTRVDAVAGCHDLVFQAPSHCDGAGACIAGATQNCAAQAPADCQRTDCDDVTGCGSEPFADGEKCRIPIDFSDACVDGERHDADTCASGICQDAYSEPCAVGYCEVAACDGNKVCAVSNMGHDASMGTGAQWAFNAYVRAADGAVVLWRGRVVVKEGAWVGTVTMRGDEALAQNVSGEYCASADGELSWRFKANEGLGALTFRGLLSTAGELGVAWEEGGTAFMLLHKVVTLPISNVKGRTFRLFGFGPADGATEAFAGSLAVAQTGVVSGSWVTSSGKTLTLGGTVNLAQPNVYLLLTVGDDVQTWHGFNAGTTGITWFVRHRVDTEQYESSLLIAVDETYTGPTPPTLTGRFRLGAFDFDRVPLATHGDTEFSAGVVTSLRQISPDGTLWRMTSGPANTLVVGTDGSYLQSTAGPAGATVRRAGHIGLWSDTAAGFFVDIEAAPVDPNDAQLVPAAPRFRFGFRPH